MTKQRQFDIVVIGGGPGGEASAVHAARAGAQVALVERELVGGECPYWGCMPSKALVVPGQIATEAQRHAGVREMITRGLDTGAVLHRRDEVIRHLDDSSHATRIKKHGITIIRGEGRIAGIRSVEVDLASGEGTAKLLASQAVILAPGTRASIPPIQGIEQVGAWTNREAVTTKTVPESLIIVGGGVIAAELAYAFSTLGSSVTILESSSRILKREEPEASRLVHESLSNLGVNILCGSRAESVTRSRADQADSVSVGVSGGGLITASKILLATGRTVNSQQLGLESIGVTAGRSGVIEVTSCMQVPSHDWLYVVGDANGRAQLTHTAVYQAKVAARNALGIETHCVEDELAAPRVIFTDPQICATGHTLESARAAGLNVRAFDRDPQRTAAGSFHAHGTHGLARLVVDLDSSCIVGATFVGSDLSELLHSATIAIVGRVAIDRLLHCVAPFPTRSDVWNRLLELIESDEKLGAGSGSHVLT